MKYHQIMAVLTEEPLLITPAARNGLLKLFEQHAALSHEEFKALREGTGVCGEAVELEQMQVDEFGIAHIPIGGPLGRGLGKFEKGAGAVDYEDIMCELDQADADKTVKAILLDIDSPGGMICGMPETSDRILAVEKPIYAFSACCMASAAYYLGAATDGIFITKSAQVGSIGVYAPFMDTSKMAAMAGLKVQVFSSGKYKGMGVPGTSLTKEQQELLQQRVMQMAQMFYEHIQATRPEVAEEDMQGQMFMGQMAADHGLADQVVRDKEEVMQMLR